MTPYYADDLVTIYHGDCREVMPELASASFDVVFADPPYGIGKAAWDVTFDFSWSVEAARLAPVLAVTPGVWNLTAMPTAVASLTYRWTLAAHLRNGMGRGALGRGNWIPCVIYSRPEDVTWTAAFADWCDGAGVSKDDLGRVTSTSDMAAWWVSRLPHRAQVPALHQWKAIQAAFNPPSSFDDYVLANDPVPAGIDSASFVVATEPMPEHPSPKPLTVMRWFLDRIPGYRLPQRGVLDPFMGSGTTLRAAKDVSRRAIGIEIEERYCEIAAQRCSQEVLGLLA